MTRPRFEVADVLRQHGDVFLGRYSERLSHEQRRVVRSLMECRTAALGGHVEECDHCGHKEISYNSCRNRHCPKCRATAAAKWMDAREAELLPVEYFHVVLTLPASLGPLALQNQRLVYGLLFRTAAETLQQIAADPKHLGAQIGFLAVLHTWGQNLQYHPHVHCVVPGGGLSPDGLRWISCHPRFFLPVRVLSRLFRGKFLALLRDAFDEGKLSFHGKLVALADIGAFRRALAGAARAEWIVYAKPPFGGPRQVLKYLARYTHRVAISNHRLTAIEGDEVEFLWKDYSQRGERKRLRIKAIDFIHRFLLHVLPAGFVRLRHYGFLANKVRRKKLALCRALCGVAVTSKPTATKSSSDPGTNGNVEGEATAHVCPICKVGHMVITDVVLPARLKRAAVLEQRRNSKMVPFNSS